MKIVITYERADILKLVEKDLAEREMAVKKGVPLIYKGALQVRLEIETEDPVGPAMHLDPAVQLAPPNPDRLLHQKPDGADNEDMSNVLAASRRIEATKVPVLGRPLGPNESFEYPKG